MTTNGAYSLGDDPLSAVQPVEINRIRDRFEAP